MNKSILFILTIIFLFSCTPKEVIEEVSVPCMGIGYIYTGDSILYYQKHQTEQTKKLSKSYLAKARTAEKSDYNLANRFYKRAIALNPQKELYEEYLEFLKMQKNKLELERVFDLLTLEQMINGEWSYALGAPSKELYISRLINELNQGKNFYYGDFYPDDELDISISDIKKAFLNSIDVEVNRETLQFKMLIISLSEEEEIEEYIKSAEAFDYFLKSFPTVGPEFKLTTENISEFKYLPSAEVEGLYQPSYLFKKLLPQDYRYSDQFELNQRMINDDALHHSIIYSLDTSALSCPLEMRHITYYYAFYDQETLKPIKTLPLAWQSGNELVICEVNGRSIHRTHYERVWQKPYAKNQKDNRIVELKELKKEEIYLDDMWIDMPNDTSFFSYSNNK